MSFSLSSLLNPAPQDGDEQQQQLSPTMTRKDSLPPIQYVQSPQQQHAPIFATPQYASPKQQAYPPAVTQQEAAQVLASLATAPPMSQQYGYSPPYDMYDAGRRSSEARPGSSGYSGHIELPPPSASSRKASSPMLEQYRVGSRSPEQRRQSTQPGFTLPPLQNFASPPQEQERRQSIVHNSPPGQHTSYALDSHVAVNSSGEHGVIQPPPQHESDSALVEPTASHPRQPSPPPLPQSFTSNIPASMDGSSEMQSQVKQENTVTPPALSPIEAPQMSGQAEADGASLKPVASLKSEPSMRNPSPLRDASVPMPSTEQDPPAITKKRPAPSKTKKGTATTTKRAPSSKKRKVETIRSETPSSHLSKPTFKSASSKVTPANSSPAPSNRSYSREPTSEPYNEDDDDDDDDEGAAGSDDGVYCICRRPDNGQFMIGCDGDCDDWFHGKCVGIQERDKNLIDKYICPNCVKAGVGRTTWKRMCRRGGCRQPARVVKGSNGKAGSKYCSDECGVLYFKEMVARTRGREEGTRTRRKSSATTKHTIEDDIGAKGGALAAGEVKALIDSSKSADDFKKLGEGVLSPPTTPDGKTNSNDPKESDYTEQETAALERIHTQKEDARSRHQILKDRMKFVTLAKQSATRTAAEKELKQKDYCGYDPRIEWTDAQFQRWRNSATGKQAFELDTLQTEVANGHMEIDEDEDADGNQVVVCDRKKCARHLEWTKLAVDDLRFEMQDNGDAMRALEREERDIKERAALRGRMGAAVNGEGEVEVHESALEAEDETSPVDRGGKDGCEGMEVDVAKTNNPVVDSVETAPSAVQQHLPEAMVVDAVA